MRYKLLVLPILLTYYMLWFEPTIKSMLGISVLMIFSARLLHRKTLLEACMIAVLSVLIIQFSNYLVGFNMLLKHQVVLSDQLPFIFTHLQTVGLKVMYVMALLLVYRFFVSHFNEHIHSVTVGQGVLLLINFTIVIGSLMIMNVFYRFFVINLNGIFMIPSMPDFLLVISHAVLVVVFLLLYMITRFWTTHFKFIAYQTVAETDELTGVMNRQSGLKRLGDLYRAYKGTDREFVLCFIDVNNLKTVNDQFGHQEGDRMIVSIATSIQEGLRDLDFICRIGGDEFLICFDNCSIEAAEKAWQRISSDLERLNLSMTFPYKISVSHGFSSYQDHPTLTPKELIQKADAAMYENKRRYKSRMV